MIIYVVTDQQGRIYACFDNKSAALDYQVYLDGKYPFAKICEMVLHETFKETQ